MKLIRGNQNQDLWNPFTTLEDLQSEANQMFNRSLWTQGGVQGFSPDIDVQEERDRYLVKVDLPGFKKDEFKVEVEGEYLTIRGERKEETERKEKKFHTSERFYGAFARTTALPTAVKSDQVKATYKDGVLQIELPKVDEAKPKQITIEVD
jgi:HSP20 family protein